MNAPYAYMIKRNDQHWSDSKIYKTAGNASVVVKRLNRWDYERRKAAQEMGITIPAQVMHTVHAYDADGNELPIPRKAIRRHAPCTRNVNRGR
jgi:hypothetical protein